MCFASENIVNNRESLFSEAAILKSKYFLIIVSEYLEQKPQVSKSPWINQNGELP